MGAEIHDSNHCDCEMCQFAQNASQANSGLFGVEQGEKIDSSPPSASGIAIPAPDFEHEWLQAPRWATRTTEHDSAEYWFLRGTIAEQLRQTQEDNRIFRRMAEQRGLL